VNVCASPQVANTHRANNKDAGKPCSSILDHTLLMCHKRSRQSIACNLNELQLTVWTSKYHVHVCKKQLLQTGRQHSDAETQLQLHVNGVCSDSHDVQQCPDAACNPLYVLKQGGKERAYHATLVGWSDACLPQPHLQVCLLLLQITHACCDLIHLQPCDQSSCSLTQNLLDVSFEFTRFTRNFLKGRVHS